MPCSSSKLMSTGCGAASSNSRSILFECQSNYAVLAAMRCNFDAQDLRRALAHRDLWMGPAEEMPHVGARPQWGYMNALEWNGKAFETRPGAPTGDAPLAWGRRHPS